MEQKEPGALTNEELLQAIKKMKTTRFYDAGIIGFLIGVACYGTIKGGFGIFTFIPLVYIPIATKNNKKYTALKEQLKERGL